MQCRCCTCLHHVLRQSGKNPDLEELKRYNREGEWAEAKRRFPDSDQAASFYVGLTRMVAQAEAEEAKE